MKRNNLSVLKNGKPWNRFLSRSALSMTAAVMAAGAAVDAKAAEVMEEEETPFVTGSLSLAMNTHFISYGADVWATGSDWDDPLFNPSIELSFDLGNNFTAFAGLWSDVNDNAPTSIGGSYAVQEIDVWLGVSYAYEDWSFTLIYQDWMYASQSEIIVDGIIAYDHWLAPSLTIHSRVDNGFSSDMNGIVGVLGVAPSWELGMVSVSVPVNVAFNTDDFHGGDSGWTFANIGAGASIPMDFMPGNWTFDAGVTLWHTPDDTVPNNPEETFVTGSAGVSLSF